jgi:hypothetical protein
MNNAEVICARLERITGLCSSVQQRRALPTALAQLALEVQIKSRVLEARLLDDPDLLERLAQSFTVPETFQQGHTQPLQEVHLKAAGNHGGTCSHGQLCEDSTQVRGHRPRADLEDVRDGFVWQSLGHQPHDFQFSWAQTDTVCAAALIVLLFVQSIR